MVKNQPFKYHIYMKSIYQTAYSKGFLPGPAETKEDFFKRIEATERVLLHPKKYITDKSYAKATLSPFGGAALLTNTKNRFYHAAATSIIELKDGLILPVISMPTSRLISKEEVLKHELVHARRALFEEPKFEEAIAFRTSKSKFRALLSPMFSNSIEAIIFLSCTSLTYFSKLPLIVCGILFALRGIHREVSIIKCLSYLKKHTGHSEEVLAAMLDAEIIAMSKGQLGKIDFSLFRWEFIQTLFGKIK